jgi:hypothetical protein
MFIAKVCEEVCEVQGAVAVAAMTLVASVLSDLQGGTSD